ncbi:DNA primase [Candidatus Gracilibacteria bacterium]|nr:DNA primase [Candidatus Gracilibacteria bacterium]
MMEVPRLHPDTIEDVKQRVDIYDVVSENVVLRKRGKDYVGLCPFHDEKTPSFTVSSSKQMYYCFGCNAGGGAVKFLMELRKQSFSDVVLDLAGRYQIPVKTLEPEQRQELQRQLSVREQLYEILALTTSFYQHALRQSQGEIALKYLKSDRNLSEETIQQFQLGYAPAGWETLYRYLVEQKRYPLNLVEEAGLIKLRKTGNGYYDVFRDRIIIPICDSQGRVIAFGSRTVQTRNFASPQEPKYLNSPETPLFDKSKTLFALDKAKHSISKEDRAVVVEGYFDAIALHAAGITNAVASLGTAFSQQHIRLLMRYTESKQVIFNFDADNAGTSATHRAINEIETLVNTGLVQVRILNLPDGKDADEFLNSSPEAVNKYRQLIQSAPLWFDWQIQQLLKGRSLKQADQFEQVAQNMVKLLNKLEDSNQRTYYIRYCAEILSLGDVRLIPMHVNSLFSQVRKTKRRFVSIAEPTVQSTSLAGSEKSLLETAETDLLGVYLHCSRFRDEIIEALEEKELLFTLPHHRFLWRQIVELQEIGNEPYRLYSQLQDRLAQFPEQMNQLSHLFHLSETKHWEDSTRAPIVIRTAIASLEQVVREKYRRYCQQQIQQLSPNTDVEQMQYYYQEIQNTIVQIRELEKLRHNSQV